MGLGLDFFGDFVRELRAIGMFQWAGRVFAALAMSTLDLQRNFGHLAPRQAEVPADHFTVALFKAHAVAQTGSAKGMELLLNALDAALKTPEPHDDFLALSMIALNSPLSWNVPALGRCVEGIERLLRQEFDLDALTALALSIFRANSLVGMSQDHEKRLADVCSALLERRNETPVGARPPIFASQTERLAIFVSQSWLRLGVRERAEAVTAFIDVPNLSNNGCFGYACLRADMAIADGNLDGALDTLTNTLFRVSKATAEERRVALRKLIRLWPIGRYGLPSWVSEYRRGVEALEGPVKELYLVVAAIGHAKVGDCLEALDVARRPDVAAMRGALPARMNTELESDLAELQRLIAGRCRLSA
jgi:hypothetical protein